MSKATDEEQAMALAAWMAEHGDIIPADGDESDASRAVRGLEAMRIQHESLSLVYDALSATVCAPKGATLGQVLRVAIAENDSARAALAEALDAIAEMTKADLIQASTISTSAQRRWRSALVRPWAAGPRAEQLLANLGISVAEDADGFVIEFHGLTGPCLTPGVCDTCADEAAQAMTGTPLADD